MLLCKIHLRGAMATTLTTQSNQPSRYLEIDFLRGLALIFIMLDHMPISFLSMLTLQHYTLFDATEVFVFLSGFCVALAYQKIKNKKNERQAQFRFLKRSFELYIAFLVIVGAMLLIGYICLTYNLDAQVVKTTEIQNFLNNPKSYILNALILFKQPYFSSILPMYIVFCLMSIILIPLLRHFPFWVLALSFTVWLMSSYILTHTIWSFNPFAWQFIFVCGLFCYLYPLNEYVFEKEKNVLFIVCIMFIIFFGSFKLLTQYQFAGIDKLNLATVRLVSFFSVAWVAFCLKNYLVKMASYAKWIQLIGKNSLPSFVATTILSLSINTLFEHFKINSIVVGLLADLSAILLLYLVAYLSEQMNKRKKIASLAHEG